MTIYCFIRTIIKELWNAHFYKKLLLSASLILTVLIIGINLTIPLLLKNCITLLSEQELYESNFKLVMLLTYGICWTLSHLFSQIREIIIFKISEECLTILNLRVFSHLHALDMKFHYERKIGSLMHAVTRAQSVFIFILWGFLYLAPTIIEIVISAGIIFYFYGYAYSLLLLFILAIYMLFSLITHKKLEHLEKNAQEKESGASSYIADSLLNTETIKYFNTQTYEYNTFHRLLNERHRALMSEHNCRQLIFMGQSVIAGFGLTILAWLSAKAIRIHTLHVSDFVLMNAYFLQFILPLLSFGFYARSFKKNIIILQELIALLMIKPTIRDLPEGVPFADDHIDVVFDKVSFWHENKCILDSLSFVIPAGKTIAIVGTTGAGKSTIARLIYRLYDVLSGTIYINGKDVKLLQQESFQKKIGIVPQDTVLFNNTIFYNIAYGQPTASMQEVEQVAQQAGLHFFINSLPEGYQTIVGERGLKLSGGEKQRIAIARALLKKPLLYIFDEATASLDTITEKQIQKNIEAICDDSTKLIIAHRISTIIHADEILVLENGKIVERGNHETLLTLNNHYKALWEQSIK